MQIVIMSDGLKLLILFVITILEFIPKLRPFRELFQLIESPLHYQQPYASLYFLCSDIDFSQPSFSDSNFLYPFAHLLFISITLTHFFCLGLKRFRFSFTSPVALYSCPFFCKRFSKLLNPINVFFK